MADILKEILKNLPKGKISEAGFEGANIVLYTNKPEFFLKGREIIKGLVDQFKKRIELRADPSITLDEEKAKEIIKKIIPEEAGLKEIIFDSQRSRLILHVEKPGLAIGQQGSLLNEIREKTFYIPLVRRIPPIRSKIIEGIRAVLYQNSDYRRKFLNKVGHRVYDGWLREKKHEWIRISFLGGARQVGRSCLFLQTPESRILLDCGLDVASETEFAPLLDAPEFNLKELDAVVVSHAHLDHSGLIPSLFKFGYEGPVYATAPTRDTMALLQLDLVKIQRSEGKEPFYTGEEIKKMVLHTICLDYNEVTDLTPDVRLTFFNAGHILGSSLVHLNIGNGLHNLIYSGDLKYGQTHLLEPANPFFSRGETLIIESTYGGRDNVLPPQAESDEYTAEIFNKIIERGGKILMPVLGSGRAQEVMVIVEKMIREGKMKEIPVYLDGLLWDVTAIHTAYPEFLNHRIRKQIFHRDDNPFLSPYFKRIGSQKERKIVIEKDEPALIMATSGMLVGGPSVEYLKGLAENKNNALIFSCYQAEGSLGRRIQQGEKEIIFRENGRNVTYNINLEVLKLEITGHSDRRQLINYVDKCEPRPKKIIINHGENKRCLDLSSSLHKIFKIETIVPRNLESVRLK